MRGSSARLPGALLVVVLALASAAPATAQPRVRLIATGGTIANSREGRWDADTLLASAPALATLARIEPETFSRSASLSLSLDDWIRLSRLVNRAAAEHDVAGVVVTSGTDSLEELAWFLDLTVRSDTPVIVTGAIKKPGMPDADGPGNLEDAVRVAVSREARGHGTLVVFHGSIFSARDAVKTSTINAEAFGGTSAGPIGNVRTDGVRLAVGRTRRHGAASEFDVNRIAHLPRVDVLLTYQGAPGDLVLAALRNGARGLVMAAAGAGALSFGELEAVSGAIHSGIPVVLASRVEDGHVTLDDLVIEPGLIPAGDLAPVKARILLMLGISQGLSTSSLARLFTEY